MTPHPESVPINILSKVPGTPMADNADVPFFETLKMIAVARILMPKATVRLSAGRAKLSASEQTLCFMAGADSFFSSESKVMLTKAVPSPAYDEDKAMLASLGMTMRAPFSVGSGERSTSNAQHSTFNEEKCDRPASKVQLSTSK
jgi:biotin synthase